MTGGDRGIPADVRAWFEARVRERGPVPKVDRMFRHGRSYHECALRCLELRGEDHAFLFPPALVLLAFVNEIYLKTLLTIEGGAGKAPKSHDHGELFGRLTATSQTEIADRYRQRHGRTLSNDLPAFSDLFVGHR